MSRFAWTEAMSVGVPALDADHRCLVRIIGLLEDVQGEDADRIVEIVMDTLAVYCRYHFAREERVMSLCGFPELPFHHAEHDAFTHVVDRLRQQRAGVAPVVLAKELLEYLKEWLLHHILIQDFAYKPFLLPISGLDDQLCSPVLMPECTLLSASE